MKLTLSRKLIMSFAVIALILVISASQSYRTTLQTKEKYTGLLDNHVQILIQAKQIQTETLLQNDGMKDYFVSHNIAAFQKMKISNDNIERLMEDMLLKVKDAPLKEQFEAIRAHNAEYKKTANDIMSLPFDQSATKANEVLFPLSSKIHKLAEAVAEERQAIMDSAQREAQAEVDASSRLSMILSIAAVVLSLATGIVTARYISRPIRQLTEMAKLVASGDLRVKQLTLKHKDEIGELAHSFNEMSSHLRTLIGRVEAGAAQVSESANMLRAHSEHTAKATEQIAEAAQVMAGGAETQVRSTLESARAMEEMAIGIGRIAESSSAVYEAASATSTHVAEGNVAIQQAVSQMDAIYQSSGKVGERVKKLGERSDQIGEITGLITSIASQTSLLALNASIEAARAGEQGRGFMVVAAEVKKLAIQAEQAAKQISEMIAEVQMDTQEAVKGMHEGMAQAKQGQTVIHSAGETFAAIMAAMSRVTNQIEEVSATAEEISSGSEEVTASVEETAKIAQSTSERIQQVAATGQEQMASMEEVAASATSLSRMADELQKALSHFRV